MSNNKQPSELDMSDLGSALPAAATALSAEDRAGLVNALKNKLQSLAGQHSDVLETLSPTVRKRVEVLRQIQVLQAMIQMGVLVSTGDMTAFRRTAQFFLNSFEERLVAQRKEREMANVELGFKKPLSKEERNEKKKQRLAAIG